MVKWFLLIILVTEIIIVPTRTKYSVIKAEWLRITLTVLLAILTGLYLLPYFRIPSKGPINA